MSGVAALTRRLRDEQFRRIAVSVFIVVSLITAVINVMPDTRLQRDVLKVSRPYGSAVGLDQNWGVFAPNPRQQTISMRARIRYSNGTAEWWTIPDGSEFLGDYWDYRWRKWLEYIVNNDFKKILFKPLADWLVRTHHDASHVPVRITFVARWFDIYPPGLQNPFKGKLRSDWREAAYYSIPVTPAMLRGS